MPKGELSMHLHLTRVTARVPDYIVGAHLHRVAHHIHGGAAGGPLCVPCGAAVLACLLPPCSLSGVTVLTVQPMYDGPTRVEVLTPATMLNTVWYASPRLR